MRKRREEKKRKKEKTKREIIDIQRERENILNGRKRTNTKKKEIFIDT